MNGWRRLADLLIQREALIARVRRGSAPELVAVQARGPEVDRLVESLLLSDSDSGAGRGVDVARERIDQIRSSFDPPLATARAALADDLAGHDVFAILAANAGLDEISAELFGLVCAIETEPVHQRLIGWLQDDASARRATLGLIDRIGGPGAVTTFGPDAPLLRAGYVTVDGDAPWSARQVVVEGGVLWALAGARSRDPDLPNGVDVHSSDRPGEAGARLVVVHGGDRWRRRQTGTDLAAAARYLVAAPPSDAAGWRALVREATIGGCGVVLDVVDGLSDEARRWIEWADQVVWVVSSSSQLPLESLPRRRWRELEAGDDPAGPEEWAELLPEAEMGRHPLSADQIRQVSRAYDAVGSDLDAAVRRLASGAIDRLARRIRPRRTWDDLVVPADRSCQLREVVSRYRQRSRVHDEWGYNLGQAAGLIALFHGPSGTGKTLAAEIIANDLGLDLFKIDLSAMVSKYIGETEKNLEEVFNAASAANVVLLFDEADSLFGKRSEVTDAKDRYANIEVSYLLQRVESYEGVAILTTNLVKNIDQAFLRRIDVLTEFALPEQDERLALWRLGFPPRAPLADDVDRDLLAAQFKLAGGNIHSVTLTAAFLAAATGGPITMGHVIEALGREYTKLGRLRTAEDFGPWLAAACD